jgi:LacI family transcriptional regulator
MIRMKDIARELGISVVTVSKVLRNHGDISEETRNKVLKRMRELNYRPNFAARALVTGRTYTVGLVVPDLIHPFFAEIAKHLAATLRIQGYSLIIASADGDPELEQEEISRLLACGLDALVIASSQWTVESFRHIEERKTPYILIDRQFTGLPANFVGVDDQAVGILATEHLVTAGCRRIAHIRGPEVSTALGRLEGYRRTLARHNMGPLPGYVPSVSSSDEISHERGARAMKALLKLKSCPDGLFCYNDPTAIGAMQAIFEAGLRVPDDIAVIGCGNLHYDAVLRVPLTSIDQQSSKMAEETAGLALALIESKERVRPFSIILDPKLIVRASTQRVPTTRKRANHQRLRRGKSA